MGLSQQAPQGRLLVVVAGGDRHASEAGEKMSSLGGVVVKLPPLTSGETLLLLSSVFGEVPHARTLAERLHTLAAGSPRETLTLARHLVDSGAIRYDGGHFMLPSDLGAIELPRSAAEAIAARMDALPALAQRLIESQALLGTGALRLDDYAQLAPRATRSQLETALMALVARQILQCEGEDYRFGYRALVEIARQRLDEDHIRATPLELYEFLRARPDTHPYVMVPHLMAAGRGELALDLLHGAPDIIERSDMSAVARLDTTGLRRTLEQALALSLQLRRPVREQQELRRKLYQFALTADDSALLRRHMGPFLAQLQQDSGLCDYWKLEPDLAPEERLKRALSAAASRYSNTPEEGQVYRVDEAIKHLATLVFIAGYSATHSCDVELVAMLPPQLEPLAPLSPVLDLWWQHAVALEEGVRLGRPLRAVERWLRVYEGLADVQEIKYLDNLRATVAGRIATHGVDLGKDHVSSWAQVVEAHGSGLVYATYLRRLAHLWEGDGAAAAWHQTQAEMRALRIGMQAHWSPLLAEFRAAALSHDLEAMKRLVARTATRAERHAGWLPLQCIAQGRLHLLRGEADRARTEFERALSRLVPGDDAPSHAGFWAESAAGQLEALLAQREASRALGLGLEYLDRSRARGYQLVWHPIAAAVAIAEAELDRGAAAAARADALIADQQALGVQGLSLAQGHATAARVAIRAADVEGAAYHGRATLTALPGLCTPRTHGLVGLLLNEARASGLSLSLGPEARA